MTLAKSITIRVNDYNKLNETVNNIHKKLINFEDYHNGGIMLTVSKDLLGVQIILTDDCSKDMTIEKITKLLA